MGKRKKNDSNKNPIKAVPLVDRLPFRPPFTREEWCDRPFSDMLHNPKISDYFKRCLTEAVRSERGRIYATILAGIAHMGRLPEFSMRSYDKFLAEATQQHFTVSQLKKALEVILDTSGPEDILPNAAAAFEFLTFVSDFVDAFAAHMDSGEEVKPLTLKIRMIGTMAFVSAVNAEFGLQKDFWKESK